MSQDAAPKKSLDEVMDEDARVLAEMGYTQELTRGMSAFSNFAVSFSIISILAGCITSYAIALRSGGPAALTIGWVVVGLFVTCVALAMAEVCSRYPTAGGLYFWAAKLAKSRRRVWAWYVGWFNFLGEIAVTAAIDFGCATTWMAFSNLVWGVEVTPERVFALFVAIIVVHALLNTFGVNLVSLLSNVSAWWHVFGTLVIVAALWIMPDSHQSVSWTLTEYHNETGWTFAPYVLLMGLLMAQYTYTGYDASAHVAEETKQAQIAAPRGIVLSVVVSLVGGFLLLYSITAAIPDGSEQGLTNLAASETGLPPAQVFLDALDSPFMAKLLLFIVCVAQFFCGMASVTANSRMSFAFSRDNALPGSKIWAKVNKRTGTPTNSIWFCVTLSVLLATPALFNTTAYFAVTSIAVIGLYIAYVIPVFRRRRDPSFGQGRWNLGRWSAPIGWIAIAWVAFIVVLFMLPQYSPGRFGDPTFNYAPVAVGVVLAFSTAMWFLVGRHHFMAEQDVRQAKALDDAL